MRRLSPRREHVLRQIALSRVSIRTPFTTRPPYSWCRDCESQVTRQTDWLETAGFITPWDFIKTPTYYGTFALTNVGNVYLERFPR